LSFLALGYGLLADFGWNLLFFRTNLLLSRGFWGLRMKIGTRLSSRHLATLVTCCGLAASTVAIAAAPEAGPPKPVTVGAESAFLDAHPSAAFYRMDDRITSVYGRAFQHADTPLESAAAFVERHAGLFGVASADLIPGSLAHDVAPFRGLMLQPETGTYRFTLVSYLQMHQDIPVFQSDLRLLVRNEPDHPLVLARSALRSLGDFVADVNVAAEPNVAGAFEDAMRQFPGIGQFTAPRVVIFAGTADVAAPASLALEFEGSVGQIGDDVYEKWHIVADAATGAVLWHQSRISDVNVTGSVKAMATPGYKADICATEVVTAMPYARATIGATVAYADVNGNFSITNAGSSAVTVGSEMRGRWFRVYNAAAGNVNPSIMSMSVTPPGPANFVHNPANSDAAKRSAANAYIGANIVRDYALSHDPAFPSIANQTEWAININVSGSCNAFYNGSSINFYAAGGGCPSTAFGSVVYHEYGHHMVNVAGSGQGQYGEGYGDLCGVIIGDDPVLGHGFQNNCNNGIRTASNNLQYPCTDAIHTCGQLLSGCFWSTRNQLVVSNPSDYLTLLGQWAVNSVQLHTGDLITPQVTIDVLTLDDNDADISNGTPHYQQIQTGFSAHNMAGPIVNALTFTYPSGRPSVLIPSGGTTITVVATPNLTNTLNTTSGKLFVDPESDGSFISIPMTYQGSNTFQGTFPAVACNTSARYYIEAKTGSGTTMRDPLNAPTSYYTAFSALAVQTVWSDDAETNPGWVPSRIVLGGGNGPVYQVGDWSREAPTGAHQGEATADFDPSPNGKAWTTGQNAASLPDVDPVFDVVLTSPTLDGTVGNAVFSYARWFYTALGSEDDSLTVQVSNNNGGSWVTMETVTTGSGGWSTALHRLGEHVALTSQMKVRFIVADGGSDTTVEAALDAFSFGYVQCSCPADFNGDSFVSGEDFDEFSAAFEAGDPSADFNGDTFVSGDDFDAFALAFAGGC